MMEERTDREKLSSDFHTSAVVCSLTQTGTHRASRHKNNNNSNMKTNLLADEIDVLVWFT